MNILGEGDHARRNDTGRIVRIVDVRLIGPDLIMYLAEDTDRDGHDFWINHNNLRPVTADGINSRNDEKKKP